MTNSPLHTHKKSMRTAYLLWLFTGVFGGHWCYLEKKMAPSIYVFLCVMYLFGIMGYVWNETPLVELIFDSIDISTENAAILGGAYIFFIGGHGFTLFVDFFELFFVVRKYNSNPSLMEVFH